MDVFDYINRKLRDTFAYFKSRTKAKYEGDRFEEWVVSNSNIQKNPKKPDGKSYWRLIEWRGDNYVSGWFALSNLAPALILERISGKTDSFIAVECKYRNKKNFFLEPRQIENYEEYIAERKPKIEVLFYLFGFGWKNDSPEEVYLIPSTAIYEYNRGTGEIRFLNTLDKIEKEDKFKDSQVILDKSKGKYYIQYKKKQNDI